MELMSSLQPDGEEVEEWASGVRPRGPGSPTVLGFEVGRTLCPEKRAPWGLKL